MSKVIWLTGISGAGKTTLGDLLVAEFKNKKLPVVMLDGDVVRDFFENDLGYSRPERIQNVKRIAFAADLLAQNGVNVVVANIAPYFEARDFVRRKLKNRYVQIYVNSSLDTVSTRDVKGYYKKMSSGQMQNLIGVDDVYEPPRNPDLIIDTNNSSIENSLKKITDYLIEKRIL
jgi:adenylylsulfate kinase